MNHKKEQTILDRLLQYPIIYHSLFWMAFLLIFTIAATLSSGLFWRNFINQSALLPVQMMAGYTMIYYQIPQLLFQKKYAWFISTFIAFVYLYSALARLSVVYLAEPFFRKDFEQESLGEILSDPVYLLVVYFPSVYVIVFLMTALKSIKDRFEERHQMEVLEKEKATVELKFLKAQLHPHFLFNTLNNLYALTLAKSDAAPEVVVKLSEMLDYMLYQCSEPFVAISKEIELIAHYISLEQLRYSEQLDLAFQHQVDNDETRIAPLILLSFVENAFKHGVRNNPFEKRVKLHLRVTRGKLFFQIENTKAKVMHFREEVVVGGGIGLSNVKRQLALHYPNRHQLSIKETEEAYLIVLTVELDGYTPNEMKK